MARTKPKKAPTDQDRSVRAVKLDGTRELSTIEPDALIWSPESNYKWRPGEGAIVRLRPPIGASDGDVERVREYFQKAGAARVTVLPRPRAEVVPASAAEKRPERAIGARQAVLELVDEANSKDRALLKELCEKVMAECGL